MASAAINCETQMDCLQSLQLPGQLVSSSVQTDKETSSSDGKGQSAAFMG